MQCRLLLKELDRGVDPLLSPFPLTRWPRRQIIADEDLVQNDSAHELRGTSSVPFGRLVGQTDLVPVGRLRQRVTPPHAGDKAHRQKTHDVDSSGMAGAAGHGSRGGQIEATMGASVVLQYHRIPHPFGPCRTVCP